MSNPLAGFWSRRATGPAALALAGAAVLAFSHRYAYTRGAAAAKPGYQYAADVQASGANNQRLALLVMTLRVAARQPSAFRDGEIQAFVGLARQSADFEEARGVDLIRAEYASARKTGDDSPPGEEEARVEHSRKLIREARELIRKIERK